MTNNKYTSWAISIVLFLSFCTRIYGQSPNILFIIADDLGVDYSNGYHEPDLLPTTPFLDALAEEGILFENVFSTPKCTPSRSTIMSGKFGIKTGVLGTPGHLSTDHISIFKAIENQTNGAYADAVIGKWHISQPADPLHPMEHGVDHYMGVLSSSVEDYYTWMRTEDGETEIENSYVTTAFTDAAIEWVNEQDQPWFLWLAHVAPHAPFHIPPDSLYTINNVNNNRQKYVASIEAMDHEIGRLLNSLSEEELENTLIIFIGDNGSPNTVLQDYPDGHGKATLYQGGIRVPMIVSGAGVSRSGERESALIHITDIYATLLEMVGAELPGGVYHSLSFKHLLDDSSSGATRDYNYSEFDENGQSGFTIRGEQYKLIEFSEDGSQEFYDLLMDSLETTNLIPIGLDADQLAVKEDLEAEATQIRTTWSCRDYIQNGDEEGIDCGGSHCAPCMSTNTDQYSLQHDISILPNPVQKELQITTELKNYSIRLTDVFGTIHYQQKGLQASTTLEVEGLLSGIYFLNLHDIITNRSITKRIVVQSD